MSSLICLPGNLNNNVLRPSLHSKHNSLKTKCSIHPYSKTKMLGTGQFGGVQIGIWNGSKGRCEVAVKTLNPTVTQPDAKVKFLQEAAIMAQFRHPNVIQLYGVVTDGEAVGDLISAYIM